MQPRRVTLGNAAVKAARIGALALAAALALGCSRGNASRGEGGATAEGQGVVATAAAQDQAGKGVPPASDRFDEANFTVSMLPKGPYRAGQAGVVEVTIDAKDPYHVNDEYPIKLKLEAVPKVVFPAPVVGKESAEIAGKRGKLTVRLTPEVAGEHRVAGRLAFSVCNDDRCLVERRDLALTIRAE